MIRHSSSPFHHHSCEWVCMWMSVMVTSTASSWSTLLWLKPSCLGSARAKAYFNWSLALFPLFITVMRWMWVCECGEIYTRGLTPSISRTRSVQRASFASNRKWFANDTNRQYTRGLRDTDRLWAYADWPLWVLIHRVLFFFPLLISSWNQAVLQLVCYLFIKCSDS